MTLPWRIGIEVELLAPPGLSRLDLARAIGEKYNGSVRRFFHPQTEPSKVSGTPVFHNLTLGFEVLDFDKQLIAQCVDDLTLQADLNRSAKPQPGWYRIVSDDERLLRLIKHQTSAEMSLSQVMQPISRLFGVLPEVGESGMIRVNDDCGFSIAIAAPLPGERERPCELITPPFEQNQEQKLEALLSIARELDFRIPLEGASHIHFDATVLKSAHYIANFINLYSTYATLLKELIGTNPNCRRLGTWPGTLLDTINSSGFRSLSWAEVQLQLNALDLVKFCDVNLVNCIQDKTSKNTIEVRILPVWLESEPIIEVATLFIAMFELAMTAETIDFIPDIKYSPESVKTFLQLLSLKEHKLKRLLA